jgi:hypothetical protein
MFVHRPRGWREAGAEGPGKGLARFTCDKGRMRSIALSPPKAEAPFSGAGLGHAPLDFTR